ncbi:MAG: OmpA family protein [Acidimicrobiia bacterium]
MAKKSKPRMRDLAETPRQHTPRYIAGQDEEGPILSGVAFALLSALALIGLMVAAILVGGNQVQGAVAADTLNFLRRSGYDQVAVAADGQDVTITGTVDSEADLTALPKAVAQLNGVQTVRATLDVAVPDAPEGPVPSDPMTISLADGVLTVTGTMPDQASIDRVTTALQASGHQLDADGLVIRERIPATDAWMAAVLAITERLNGEVDAFEIIVNPEASVATVSAVFETRQVRADVRRQAEQLFEDSPLDFVSALSVVDAPPPPPPERVVELQENLDDLIRGKVVEFEFGSAVLTPAGRRLLGEVLEALRRFPEVPVEIAGHTDSVGSDESNLVLSVRRAEAVLAYLVERGEDPDRFVVTGYGESQPVADNDTTEGRARNRRIEFIALEE